MKVRLYEGNRMKDFEVDGILMGFVPYRPEFILVPEFKNRYVVVSSTICSMLSVILYNVNGIENWCNRVEEMLLKRVTEALNYEYGGKVTARLDFDSLRNLVIVYLSEAKNEA